MMIRNKILFYILAIFTGISIIFYHQRAHSHEKTLDNWPLQIWNGRDPLLFMDIKHSSSIAFLIRLKNYFEDLGLFLGSAHFDMRYPEAIFQQIESENTNLIIVQPNVLTIFRDPVDRIVSHFLYDKVKMKKGQDLKFSDFLNQQQSFPDGQGLAYWLSGTHPEKWVNKREFIRETIAESNLTQSISVTDTKKICKKSLEMITNIPKNQNNKTLLWFGIYEQLAESIELFNFQIPYYQSVSGSRPLILTNIHRHHGHGHDHENNFNQDKNFLNTHQKNLLAKLIPIDMILYRFALQIFKARTRFMKNLHLDREILKYSLRLLNDFRVECDNVKNVTESDRMRIIAEIMNEIG